jgi:hypothetical protein
VISQRIFADKFKLIQAFPGIGIITILITFLSGCFKGDGLAPFIPPSDIRIDAVVPQQVYTNNLPVNFDARRTLTLNGPRHLTFLWTTTTYPPGQSPKIKNPGDAFTEVDGLVPGRYGFQLRVEDSAKNYSVSTFAMEVKSDTLSGAPKVSGLPSRMIYRPQDSIKLLASLEYLVNPKERKLFFLWKVIQKPAGASALISNKTEAETEAEGFIEGDYRFQLQITNELGLSATDTMTLTVLKDTLAGTSKIYDNPAWVRTKSYWTEINLVISEPTIFRYRGNNNMEVRFWDKNQQAWGSPLSENVWSIHDNSLIIQFDDDDTHPFDLTTKVMVSFF